MLGIGIALQKLIIARDTNVNEVATATGVNPQTLYSIIKRDSLKANIDDLYKVAHHLDVTLDYFYSAFLQQETDTLTSESIIGVSKMALQVTRAYDSASDGIRASVVKLLDVDKIDDPIEAEPASYRLELEAEQEAKRLSASDTCGANSATRKMA